VQKQTEQATDEVMYALRLSWLQQD